MRPPDHRRCSYGLASGNLVRAAPMRRARGRSAPLDCAGSQSHSREAVRYSGPESRIFSAPRRGREPTTRRGRLVANATISRMRAASRSLLSRRLLFISARPPPVGDLVAALADRRGPPARRQLWGGRGRSTGSGVQRRAVAAAGATAAPRARSGEGRPRRPPQLQRAQRGPLPALWRRRPTRPRTCRPRRPPCS